MTPKQTGKEILTFLDFNNNLHVNKYFEVRQL